LYYPAGIRVINYPDTAALIIVPLTAALHSALRFTALPESAFSPKVEAALRPFLMHFEQHVGLRNQKYYTPMGGGSKNGRSIFL